MKVSEVMEIAKEWVELHGSQVPGFCGAYFAGSINRLPRDDDFSGHGDVDIYVILEDVGKSGQLPRKLLYKDIILETVFSNFSDYCSAEAMLSKPMSAHNWAVPSIISDPTGKLIKLQQTVAREFPQRRWVQERCERVKQLIRAHFDEWDEAKTVEEMGLHFIWTLLRIVDLISVAHLRPPTIRKCLEQSRELLQQQDRLHLHESILKILGSAHMNRGQVEEALQECLRAFDRAAEVMCTPFLGDNHLGVHVRPYVAEGMQEMIDRGHHREAIFYISLNHRCANKAIQNDAPDDERAGFQAGYNRLMAELGLVSFDDYQHRLELTKNVADEVFLFADEVIQANPDIKE